jgi:hypothetical protein
MQGPKPLDRGSCPIPIPAGNEIELAMPTGSFDDDLPLTVPSKFFSQRSAE